jgi:hypothetical protein
MEAADWPLPIVPLGDTLPTYTQFLLFLPTITYLVSVRLLTLQAVKLYVCGLFPPDFAIPHRRTVPIQACSPLDACCI